MKRSICALVLALLPAAATAGDRPDWAFGPYPWVIPAPGAQPAPLQPPEDGTLRRVPGSSKTYTRTQLADPKNPPDWFPDEHPPMPQVVAHGNDKGARACITCHVGSGHGHPESSRLPGGTATYLARQLADFRSGARRGVAENMIAIAKGMTNEEISAATTYFASLKTMRWTNVVETDTVPKSYFTPANMRLPSPEGGTEPLGNRIVELPQDPKLVALRDPHAGFVSYVPAGSILKGQALVATGGDGKTIPCTICHGPTLKGIGDVPGIAGRSPLNIARQLYHIKVGERVGPWPALMKAAVERLDADDMLAISAYVASLEP